MGGREFSEHVNEYLRSIGQSSKTAGLIEANPQRNKHLEVATMKLLDIWVDFVNLRPDSYAEHSRGLGTIGTPQEDAFRRDLTINSLFYNINISAVEDLTGHGLDDLRQGIIRTPIDPVTTLSDDPHRALRSVRFAAKYQFRLDKELSEAARQGFVRQALTRSEVANQGVARDRISTELLNMLALPQAQLAIKTLIDLDLFGCVLGPRNDTTPPLPASFQSKSYEYLATLESLYLPNSPYSLSGSFV